MKIIALLALLILSSHSFGQGVWQEVATPNDSVRFIDFFPDGSVYTTTESRNFQNVNDSIYYTSDKGATWQHHFSLAGYDGNTGSSLINSIKFYTNEKWYFIQQHYDQDDVTFEDVSTFLQKDSIDTNAPSIEPPPISPPLPRKSIHTFFITQDTNYYAIVSNHWQKCLYKWNTLSLTWDSVFKEPIEVADISHIGFDVNTNSCLAVVFDSTFHWHTAYIPNGDLSKIRRFSPPSLPLQGVLASEITHINDSTCFCTSDIYYARTTNNGSSWTLDSLNDPISNSSFFPNGYGYATTYQFGNGTALYRTSDSGVSWKLQLENQPFIICDISIVDSLTAYFTNGKLLKTTDGGGSILLRTNDDNRQVSVEGISIYPNPVINNTCQLQYPAELSSEAITVYDMLGRRILYTFTSIGSDKTSLDLTPFPSGVYYVVMGKQRLKLIKN